jgi:predicted amino acid-binding ACT domain protein
MKKKSSNKPIITVIGGDQTGIVAQVSTLLWKSKVNIEEIKQGLTDNNFFMIMSVDLDGATVNFEQLGKELKTLANKLNLSISLYNKEIFETINKI